MIRDPLGVRVLAAADCDQDVALGTTIVLVGVVLSWWLFGLGLVITLIAVVRWVRETREEIAELPLEH